MLCRDDDTVEVPEFSDYDGDYGSSLPDFGISSNYSTLRSTGVKQELDIDMNKVKTIDDTDTGAAPKGDDSMVIKTDYGEIKSKYIYLGFGLWENTEPVEPPPPPKKPSPPPPPPKAEPIWYNCTVSVEVHKTSKELDDLTHGLDGYARYNKRKPLFIKKPQCNITQFFQDARKKLRSWQCWCQCSRLPWPLGRAV